ncbi:hypothetical protein GCM10027275_07440 [Rhabdobacter roseus]|uniref:Fork-head domain-containing protein n=1 Tax=Rhabdobacter roseus TaxID=1655419 RepID=A0A840TN45_9BACT|nr:hypothetical protein [Rhabdobacter roseus]MBB5282643.1 hypothetical protein [Rhabdobacter roseus]
MKVLTTLLWLALASASYAQMLRQTYLSDTLVAKELRTFLIDCYKANPTYGEKGVVYLIYHSNSSDSLVTIQLYQALDDRYKYFAYPPASYAHFLEKVILIYHGFYNSSDWTEEQRTFLLEEIGSRVQTTQSRDAGWVETYRRNGSLKARYQKVIPPPDDTPFNRFIQINTRTGQVTVRPRTDGGSLSNPFASTSTRKRHR